MAAAVLERRELYVDVTIKEGQHKEIFLFQVDFLKDGSFRSKEYLFRHEEKLTEEEEAPEAPEEETDITELFKEQWEQLADIDKPVDVFATDVKTVLIGLFLELQKKHPNFLMLPYKHGKKEMVHDFISMGRVVSMSAFDEQQHLSAGIRRRMKEKYHECVDEVKRERNAHIFMRQMPTGSPYELELFVTDKDYRIRKNILLPKTSNEEALTLRLSEIFTSYPEADLIVDKISLDLYRLLHNMSSFMSMGTTPAVFSLESMFLAVGKLIPSKELVENYLLYIKNLEDMRFGRFISGQVQSVHSFYLPVRISGERDWRKQFKKNTVWRADGEDVYCMEADDEHWKGKYIIRAGKEQFVLRVRKVSIKRYLKNYAVLELEAENHCYPGEMDKERINFLAAHLFSKETAEAPDSIELKIKDKGQAYSLTTVRREGNKGQIWLNGLLLLGRKKKKHKKHSLVLRNISEKMYCVKSTEDAEERELIRTAVVRRGILQEVEKKLSKAMIPAAKRRPYGKISFGQKKQIRRLYELYRYLMVSFGAEYETGRKEAQFLWKQTEEKSGTAEIIARLKEKFHLFFA